MKSFREQAIKDVAEAMGVDTEDVLFYMRPDAASGKLATYAVAQREARLKLEDVATNLINKLDETIPYINGAFSIAYSGTNCYTGPKFIEELELARAALNAVKEG